MVKLSYNQKPYRKTLMNTYGAEVHVTDPPDRSRQIDSCG